MMQKTREFTYYLGPDGHRYDLHVPSYQGRWVVSQSGWGTPPIDYVTQRGPAQHGVTVKDIFLQPRIIQLLIRNNYCDRNGYWIGRADILNAIRPNRQTTPTGTTPGQLVYVQPDSTRMALDVFITEGPRFEPSVIGKWDEWSFQEVLRFTAFDPVVYNLTERCLTFTADTQELVFPITFPITFGSFGSDKTANYLGTWLDYPVITITGPVDGLTIINTSTGERLQLTYNIAAGETVTIDLRYGYKTVVSSINGNIIGTLTTDSNLATWHLGPAPEVTGGNNVISVTGNGLTMATAVQICWHDRYFGI